MTDLMGRDRLKVPLPVWNIPVAQIPPAWKRAGTIVVDVDEAGDSAWFLGHAIRCKPECSRVVDVGSEIRHVDPVRAVASVCREDEVVWPIAHEGRPIRPGMVIPLTEAIENLRTPCRRDTVGDPPSSAAIVMALPSPAFSATSSMSTFSLVPVTALLSS